MRFSFIFFQGQEPKLVGQERRETGSWSKASQSLSEKTPGGHPRLGQGPLSRHPDSPAASRPLSKALANGLGVTFPCPPFSRCAHGNSLVEPSSGGPALAPTGGAGHALSPFSLSTQLPGRNFCQSLLRDWSPTEARLLPHTQLVSGRVGSEHGTWKALGDPLCHDLSWYQPTVSFLQHPCPGCTLYFLFTDEETEAQALRERACPSFSLRSRGGFRPHAIKISTPC